MVIAPVIGLGVGLFASLAGSTVTMMDREQERLDVASGLFACTDAILAGEDPAASVNATTGGEGFDVVFDATGSRASIETAFEYVASGGRYVLVSVVKGTITFTDSEFHRKEMTVIGSRNATLADFEQVIGAMRAGRALPEKWITHRTTMHGAVHDLPLWANRKTGLIKAVMETA